MTIYFLNSSLFNKIRNIIYIFLLIQHLLYNVKNFSGFQILNVATLTNVAENPIIIALRTNASQYDGSMLINSRIAIIRMNPTAISNIFAINECMIDATNTDLKKILQIAVNIHSIVLVKCFIAIPSFCCLNRLVNVMYY